MLSEDFALAGQTKRSWEDFYNEEIVHREQYKTLLISFCGKYYQFEPIGYLEGKMFNGALVKANSYLFVKYDSPDGHKEAFMKGNCYETIKDAVDQSEIVQGKTLKDIWDDPQSEYLDFN